MNREEDINYQLLIKHGDKFFEGTATREQFVELFRVCFDDLSAMFKGLAERGVLSIEEVGRYQWASVILPALVLTLEREPRFGTPILEEQLRTSLRNILKGAVVRSVIANAKPPRLDS